MHDQDKLVEFAPNIETTESRYFSIDEIPNNLANEKVNIEQIKMCFDANEAKDWVTQFD